MDNNKHCTDGKCDYNKHLSGVVCDVQNCVYHHGKSDCCAKEICVGPSEASCSANTACATFKPREY